MNAVIEDKEYIAADDILNISPMKTKIIVHELRFEDISTVLWGG